MKLKTLLCAEHIIIDSQSGMLSCIGVMDSIVAPQFPVLIPRMAVMAILEKEDGDLDETTGNLTIAIGEHQLAQGPLLIGFQGMEGTRSIVSMGGVVIPQPGSLRAVLTHDEQEIGEWTVRVELAEQLVT